MGGGSMGIHICACVVLLLVAMASSSLMVTSHAASTDWSTALLIKVDQSGNGDFKKIQDAIDAVPSNNVDNVFIWIKPGTYREKVVVPADKPFITLSGSKASTTIITGSDRGNIFESPTLSVLATDFVARYLTIQNTFGAGDKAVALRVSADRAAFYVCRIVSYQDTLLDDTGRHYYNNCYIEGATDFICGNAASLFERCHLHSQSEGTGAITAQRRESPSENTGYTFLGCKITGVGTCVLGRPWGPYSRVVFTKTFMSSSVLPQGWDDWGRPSTHGTAYYGEYKNYGPGANSSGRVKWSRNLTDEEAKPFLTKDMIGGRAWLRPAPTYFRRPSWIISNKGDGNK
ncbi:putative pectinesterase 11 [Macadamia integrifolia]|uniref:putative pectinesterase 11 n=1 Tax=Macadamia integrifolia TaxID=60698 RepID=UPI001C4F3AE3|nr:putative pectinesterase 11 [Macadamia integrifolia]